MGICSSCESTNVATVKLVMYYGRLQEYSYPVKVSYVLQRNPSVFICNSDEMDFDDLVSPISDDEELQPGQLYFALPLNRMKRQGSSLLFTGDINGIASRSAMVVSVSERETERGRSRSSGGGASGRRRQQYSAKLGAIPE